jgi:hypothetical protein
LSGVPSRLDGIRGCPQSCRGEYFRPSCGPSAPLPRRYLANSVGTNHDRLALGTVRASGSFNSAPLRRAPPKAGLSRNERSPWGSSGGSERCGSFEGATEVRGMLARPMPRPQARIPARVLLNAGRFLRGRSPDGRVPPRRVPRDQPQEHPDRRPHRLAPRSDPVLDRDGAGLPGRRGRYACRARSSCGGVGARGITATASPIPGPNRPTPGRRLLQDPHLRFSARHRVPAELIADFSG